MAAYRINIAAYGRLGRRYARDWFKDVHAAWKAVKRKPIEGTNRLMARDAFYEGYLGALSLSTRQSMAKRNPLPVGRSKSCYIRKLPGGKYQVRL